MAASRHTVVSRHTAVSRRTAVSRLVRILISSREAVTADSRNTVLSCHTAGSQRMGIRTSSRAAGMAACLLSAVSRLMTIPTVPMHCHRKSSLPG